MKYLLQSKWLLNDIEFVEGLAESSKKLVFVSCCPFRRQVFSKNKRIRVMNPFKAHLYGEEDYSKDFILWIDQWPSLMSERFRELRFALFDEYSLIYLSQSYALKDEDKVLKEFFFGDDSDLLLLWHERLKKLPTLRSPREVEACSMGFDSLGLSGAMLLDDPKAWPTPRQQMLFIPHLLEEHSYLYALGHRHRIAAIASNSGKSHTLRFLHWLVGHQRHREVKSSGEDKNRGNSHSKDSLSGSPRYWNALTQKWAHSFGPFLWWSRRRKET